MDQISVHMVKVHAAVHAAERPLTNREIADATGVAVRTVRAHTRRLVAEGVAEQTVVFGGFRFQRSSGGQDFRQRLDAAAAALGIDQALPGGRGQ